MASSAFIALVTAAVPCSADVIMVAPGVGTLQAAIDAASPGDQLRLTSGTYTGGAVVNKSLKIFCYGAEVGDSCIIDADCASSIALDIVAPKVQVATKAGNNAMRIMRPIDTVVRIASTGVKLVGLQLDTAFEPECGTESNGLEIDATADKVKISAISTTLGAHIHDIPPGARVSFSGSSTSTVTSEDLEPAMLIENCGGGASLGKGGIRISNTAMQVAPDGVAPDEAVVRLVNSDGVRFQKTTTSAFGSGGGIGFQLDASSDNNYLLQNRWAGSAPNIPYEDNGTGNCMKKNFSDPGSITFTNVCP